MKLGLRGRADLIRALSRDDETLTTHMAQLLGYQEMPEAMPDPSPFLTEFVSKSPSRVLAPVDDEPYVPGDVPFWRLEAYEVIAPDTLPPIPVVTRAADDPPWRSRSSAQPEFTPLMDKTAVLTCLRQAMGSRQSSSHLDVDTAIKRLSEAGWLDHIPYSQRRSWGVSMYIVEDRARRLAPYWRDQEYVTDALRYVYPYENFVVTRLEDGDRDPIVRWPEAQRGQLCLPPLESTVLVLSDLGHLANDGARLQRFWLRWGRHLRQQGHVVIALVPIPLHEIPSELAREWTIIGWGTPLSQATTPSSSRARSVTRLLTLVSPAVRVEPGLLRAIRCLFPEGRDNPGLEARVWQDDAIVRPHIVAASFDPHHRKSYQARFAQEPKAIREQVLRHLQEWRSALNAAIWFEEIASLEPSVRRECVSDTDWEDMLAYLDRFQDGDGIRHTRRFSAETLAWVRIPLKAAAQSVGKLPLNPREACHPIHGKAATESTGKLPPNPRQGCHPWQVPPAPIGAKRRRA